MGFFVGFIGFSQDNFEKKQENWAFSRFCISEYRNSAFFLKKLGFLTQNCVFSLKFTKFIVLTYPIWHINIYILSFINVNTYGLFVSKCDEHYTMQIDLGMSKSWSWYVCMTHCKIRVSLGCTSCEKYSFDFPFF